MYGNCILRTTHQTQKVGFMCHPHPHIMQLCVAGSCYGFDIEHLNSQTTCPFPFHVTSWIWIWYINPPPCLFCRWCGLQCPSTTLGSWQSTGRDRELYPFIPENCAVGEMTGKHGKMRVGARQSSFSRKVFLDSSLPAIPYGGRRKIVVVVFHPDRPDTIVGCAPIQKVKYINVILVLPIGSWRSICIKMIMHRLKENVQLHW